MQPPPPYQKRDLSIYYIYIYVYLSYTVLGKNRSFFFVAWFHDFFWNFWWFHKYFWVKTWNLGWFHEMQKSKILKPIWCLGWARGPERRPERRSEDPAYAPNRFQFFVFAFHEYHPRFSSFHPKYSWIPPKISK